MSIWTHVNGSIRLDYNPCEYGRPKFEEILKDLPEGSEGPLNYSVDLVHKILSIFGDLRDYDDNYSLYRWCCSLATKIGSFGSFRGFVFEIDNGARNYIEIIQCEYLNAPTKVFIERGQ